MALPRFEGRFGKRIMQAAFQIKLQSMSEGSSVNLKQWENQAMETVQRDLGASDHVLQEQRPPIRNWWP